MCIRIITMFSCNLGQEKLVSFSENQLKCTSREVFNLPVFTFSNCPKKKTLWLLIDNIQGENKKKTDDNCTED